MTCFLRAPGAPPPAKSDRNPPASFSSPYKRPLLFRVGETPALAPGEKPLSFKGSPFGPSAFFRWPLAKKIFCALLEQMKGALVVAGEAACVGLLLALMMYVVCGNRDSWMVPVSVLPDGLASTTAAALVCGAAFHVICEVTGLNEWYARTYF